MYFDHSNILLQYPPQLLDFLGVDKNNKYSMMGIYRLINKKLMPYRLNKYNKKYRIEDNKIKSIFGLEESYYYFDNDIKRAITKITNKNNPPQGIKTYDTYNTMIKTANSVIVV